MGASYKQQFVMAGTTQLFMKFMQVPGAYPGQALQYFTETKINDPW